MDTVGVRELKTHLSRHLKRVCAGSRLVVTERGRAIATINPVEPSNTSLRSSGPRRMVSEGRAQWAGGKPKGSPRRITLTSGPAIADTVLEDCR